MLAPRWAKAAVAYFVIGVGFGIYMTWSQNHQFPGLHAHLNLLGWASMGLIASFYKLFPELEEHKLASPGFLIYQVAFPVMMVGLYIILSGRPEVGGPITAIAGSFVTLAVLMFAAMVFTGLNGAQVAPTVRPRHKTTRRVG